MFRDSSFKIEPRHGLKKFLASKSVPPISSVAIHISPPLGLGLVSTPKGLNMNSHR